MTLEEIEDTLPNGFHDARISSISIDYVKREMILDSQILFRECPAIEEEKSDAYRTAKLTLSGLLFCVIEPPDPQYPYHDEKPLWVDAGAAEVAKGSISTKLPTPIPAEAFTHWFFVNDWNAFIYVAAMDARIELY